MRREGQQTRRPCSFSCALNEIVQAVFKALCGVNHEYYPRLKWMKETLQSFAEQPVNTVNDCRLKVSSLRLTHESAPSVQGRGSLSHRCLKPGLVDNSRQER